MVGVCEAVGLRRAVPRAPTRSSKREHRVVGAGREQEPLDRVRALGVGGGVTPAVDDACSVDALRGGDRRARNSAPSSEASASRGAASAGPSSEPRAEERAAEVRAAAAARATTRRGGRSSGRRRAVEHARLAQHARARRVARDVELVARGPRRRRAGGTCGSPSGRRASRSSENARRATPELGHVEVQGDLAAAAQVRRCRRCGRAPRARRAGRSARPGAIAASSFAERPQRAATGTPSSSSSRRLQPAPAGAVAAEPGRRDDAVARHDQPEAVVRADRAGRARRAREARRAPRARRR